MAMEFATSIQALHNLTNIFTLFPEATTVNGKFLLVTWLRHQVSNFMKEKIFQYKKKLVTKQKP